MRRSQSPYLPTLGSPPSWCNVRGGIDRAACIEVRVGELRRLAGCTGHHISKRGTIWRKPGEVRPLPHERPARNVHGRVAAGVITVNARQLHQLHEKRKPRLLGGDFRTARAATMRPPRRPPDEPFRFRRPRNCTTIGAFDEGLAGNPNKGATRSKKIGLDADWSQPLRIEKWVFARRIQPAYYLVCPGQWIARRALPPDLRASQGARDPRLPGLSTCPAGRKDPITGECPQRAYKLLLVQCTEEEDRDALIAHEWIASLDSAAAVRHAEIIARLIERYGPIMPPRVLLCQRCLGARYGNDPESSRQSYRRLAGKPDARPAKRIITKSNNANWARQMKRRKKAEE